MRETLGEVVPAIIAVYAELEEASQPAGRDELVASIKQRVSAFITSSSKSVRGANVGAVAREATNLITSYSVSIPNEFDLAVYDARKKAGASALPHAPSAHDREYALLLDLIQPIGRLVERARVYKELLGDDGGVASRLVRTSHREHFERAITELRVAWTKNEPAIVASRVRAAFAAQNLFAHEDALRKLSDADTDEWDKTVQNIRREAEALNDAIRTALNEHQRGGHLTGSSSKSEQVDLLLVVVTDIEHSAVLEASRSVAHCDRPPTLIHGEKRTYEDLGLIAGIHCGRCEARSCVRGTTSE
jgi:hypothetical protein